MLETGFLGCYVMTLIRHSGWMFYYIREEEKSKKRDGPSFYFYLLEYHSKMNGRFWNITEKC
jgi:hypothetical protein